MANNKEDIEKLLNQDYGSEDEMCQALVQLLLSTHSQLYALIAKLTDTHNKRLRAHVGIPEYSVDADESVLRSLCDLLSADDIAWYLWGLSSGLSSAATKGRPDLLAAMIAKNGGNDVVPWEAVFLKQNTNIVNFRAELSWGRATSNCGMTGVILYVVINGTRYKVHHWQTDSTGAVRSGLSTEHALLGNALVDDATRAELFAQVFKPIQEARTQLRDALLSTLREKLECADLLAGLVAKLRKSGQPSVACTEYLRELEELKPGTFGCFPQLRADAAGPSEVEVPAAVPTEDG